MFCFVISHRVWGCEDITCASVYSPDQLPTHRDGAGYRHPSSAEMVCCFLCFGCKVHKVVDMFDILWTKFTFVYTLHLKYNIEVRKSPFLESSLGKDFRRGWGHSPVIASLTPWPSMLLVFTPRSILATSCRSDGMYMCVNVNTVLYVDKDVYFKISCKRSTHLSLSSESKLYFYGG